MQQNGNTENTTKDSPTRICNKLKDYFNENGMKQCDIASVLDITKAAVSNQLNGRPFGANSAKQRVLARLYLRSASTHRK